MKIRLTKKYEVESDSNGWTCFQIVVLQSGKYVGTEDRKAVFYAATLAGLIRLLPEYEIRTGDLPTVQAAVEELKKLGDEIEKTLEGFVAGGIRKAEPLKATAAELGEENES